MAIEARISGAETLRRVAARMRAEGYRDLASEMGRALAEVAKQVEPAIREEADRVMPSSGGYRTLLSRSLKFRVSKRTTGNQAGVILRTYADGTKERRDIRALEAGKLRHPVFGRSRKIKRGHRAGTILPNAWTVTTIRPGFHKRGVEGAADKAADSLLEVIEEYAARIVGDE